MVAQPLPSEKYENQTAASPKIKPHAGLITEPPAVRKSHGQKKASSRDTKEERQQQSSALPEKAEQQKTENRRTGFSEGIDDETPEVFATPRDELRAIYFRKTARQISPALLTLFFETIELHAVPIADAMQELRRHAPHPWRNPDGFLTHFAKKIRSKMPERVPALQLFKTELLQVSGPCPKCRGGGRILELTEGQRPRQTDQYCDCPRGKEINATEQRIRSASATAKNENPPVAAAS
jgi:hypothetical protein